MSRHLVNVPEYAESGRRRMTAGEFIRDYAVTGSFIARIMRLDPPVWARVAWADDQPPELYVTDHAGRLFRLFEAIGSERGLILGLGCRDWQLGPHGLATINYALRRPAVRRGGLSIVRHFCRHSQPGGIMSITRDTLPALFSFLEIRPLSTSLCPIPH